MMFRSQLDRFVDRVAAGAAAALTRQQRRSLDRRARRSPPPSLVPESLEARALLAVVVPGYEVTQDWGSGFQGAMTLENRDTQPVASWTVSFDYAADITSIWDAKVVSRDGGRYTISDAGWNASLVPGGRVAFGFIGKGDTAAPTNYTINGEPVGGGPATDPPTNPTNPPADETAPPTAPVAPPVTGISASFRVVSDWGSGFTGDVMLANDSATMLSDWRVRFDFNGEIGALWNGQIESRTGSTYVVKGAGWNADLAAGGQLSFGFNGSPGGAAAVLTGLTVFADGVLPEVPPTDSGPVTDPGSDPVSPPSDPGNDPGTDPVDDGGNDPVAGEPPPSSPPADPGSDPGSTPGDDTADDPVVDVPASELPIASYDGVIAAYFPEWGIYGRNYQLDDVPAEKITHLIYAFANLTAAGEMTLFDSYAAVEKRFGAHESVSGEADQWYYPPEDPRSQQTIWGNFNQLAQLKEKYPHLRTSIAVGGWTLSTHFSTVTSTAAGRETFANSIVEFLTTYTMFDGVDFDWEYPGGGGLESNSVSPNDGANYAALLANVRSKLDVLGEQSGRTYEISVASPAGLDKIANFNLEGLTPSVDFFNVMTYDFHGTWENTTGHQAAFTGDPIGYDIETAINAYLDAGVPKEKIVLGAPLYTRAWSGVADGGDGGYDERAAGGAPGTFERGVYDYKDLLAQVQDPASGWQLYWDDVAQASYVYNAREGFFSSFETPTSIALKAQWVKDMGLGGMMFWDLTNDATDSPESLLDAAFRSLVMEEDLDTIRGRSSLNDEIIIGGDGVIAPWDVG